MSFGILVYIYGDISKHNTISNMQTTKNINTSFFESIDTKEKAYILGLITSDGGIDNNGYGIQFTSKDYELINIVKRELQSKHAITQVNTFDKRTNKTYIYYKIIGYQ